MEKHFDFVVTGPARMILDTLLVVVHVLANRTCVVVGQLDVLLVVGRH